MAEDITDKIENMFDNNEDEEKAELLLAKTKREELEKSIENNVWGFSSLGLEAKKAAMTMLSTKNGMYAKVPIVCKGENCPYAETCLVVKADIAPIGEPCPIEATQIEMRAQGYIEDYDLDQASFTDRVLMNEVIRLDILIERCQNLMAIEGTPVVEIVAGMTENGEEFTQPSMSKAIEAYERFTKKRNEIFKLMMGTRSDKKQVDEKKDSLQSILAQAIEREQSGDFIIDVKPDNLK